MNHKKKSVLIPITFLQLLIFACLSSCNEVTSNKINSAGTPQAQQPNPDLIEGGPISCGPALPTPDQTGAPKIAMHFLGIPGGYDWTKCECYVEQTNTFKVPLASCQSAKLSVILSDPQAEIREAAKNWNCKANLDLGSGTVNILSRGVGGTIIPATQGMLGDFCKTECTPYMEGLGPRSAANIPIGAYACLKEFCSSPSPSPSPAPSSCPETKMCCETCEGTAPIDNFTNNNDDHCEADTTNGSQLCLSVVACPLDLSEANKNAILIARKAEIITSHKSSRFLFCMLGGMRIDEGKAPKSDLALGHANIAGTNNSCGANHGLRFSEFIFDDKDNYWLDLLGLDTNSFSNRLILHEYAHVFYHNYKLNNFSALMRNRIKNFLAVRWDHCSNVYATLAVMAQAEVTRLFNASKQSAAYKSERNELIKDSSKCPDPTALGLLALKYWVRANKDVAQFYTAKAANMPAECLPLPGRFAADFHAHQNENEYFAIALELYYFDSPTFERSYSASEKAYLKNSFLDPLLMDMFDKYNPHTKTFAAPYSGAGYDIEKSFIKDFAKKCP